MARMLIAILLLTALAEAQVTTTFGELSGAGSGPIDFGGSSGFEYDKLRQGSEEYAEVSLYTSRNVFVGGAKVRDARLQPTRIAILPGEGFEISRVIYPRAHQERFRFDAKPIDVLQTQPTLRFRFKLRSAPSVPVGSYVLKAKLSFQTVNDSGISEAKELPIDIPVEVVGHDAKVEFVDRSIAGIRGVKPDEWAGMVLLAPVWIPLSLFMMLIGWDGC